ncbi:hypothetical protein LIY46_09620 [Fusobacterium varium]
MKIQEVKRVAKTNDYTVVNSLLKDGWVLLGIYPENNDISYILGHIPKN